MGVSTALMIYLHLPAFDLVSGYASSIKLIGAILLIVDYLQIMKWDLYKFKNIAFSLKVQSFLEKH